MNIGFDLDKIFIDFPPLIPPSLIRKLYGEKSNGHLSYRFPGSFEQKIRQFSHIPLLRRPMRKNIRLLEKMQKNTKWSFFLISSRYSFLEKQTEQAIDTNHLRNLFKKIYFNYTDEQPHIFKSEALMKEKIDAYIDDDLPLLLYLAKTHPTIQFFWMNTNNQKNMQKNVTSVTSLSEFFEKL